jgi:hypothetical protein
MAKQIYQLPSKVAAVGSDEIAIQETGGGTTKKVRVEDLANGITHDSLGGSGSYSHAQIDATIAGLGNNYINQVSNATDNVLYKSDLTSGTQMTATRVYIDDSDRLYGHGMVMEDYAAASIELGSPHLGKIIRFTAGVPVTVELPHPTTDPQRQGFQVGLIQGTDSGQLQIKTQGADVLVSHSGSPTGYNFQGGKGSCVVVTQSTGSPPHTWVMMGDYGGIADPNNVTNFTKQWNFNTWQLTDGSPGSPSVLWDLDYAQVGLLVTGSPVSTRAMNAPLNMVDGGHYTLIIQQGSPGGHDVTFGSPYVFGEYGSPVIAKTSWGDKTILTFISDGTYMYCGTGLEPDKVTGLTAQHYFQQQTLQDGSPSIAWNLNTHQVAKVTLDGGFSSRNMGSPTNQKAGSTYILMVTQGSPTSSLNFPSNIYKWGDNGSPQWSVVTGKTEVITFISDGTYMYGTTLTGY